MNFKVFLIVKVKEEIKFGSLVVFIFRFYLELVFFFENVYL